MKGNIIYVIQTDKNKAILKYKTIEAVAFIGENGLTIDKKEGDKKTPIGTFDLGIAFGMHCSDELKLNQNVQYIKLTNSMYWVSDYKSQYYNKFVDTKDIQPDWDDAEHLSDYTIQYDCAIEIKSNPECIPQNGSAIFIHCENDKPTQGCVAIKREKMLELLSLMDVGTKIKIEGINKNY